MLRYHRKKIYFGNKNEIKKLQNFYIIFMQICLTKMRNFNVKNLKYKKITETIFLTKD